MVPSLFTGAAADAAAPTWLPEPAAAAGDNAQGAAAADVFSDLLAATIDLAAGPAGAGVEAAPVPGVPSRPDLWLTEFLGVSHAVVDADSMGAMDVHTLRSASSGQALEEPADAAKPTDDIMTMSWAIPVPVPVPLPIAIPSPAPTPAEHLAEAAVPGDLGSAPLHANQGHSLAGAAPEAPAPARSPGEESAASAEKGSPAMKESSASLQRGAAPLVTSDQKHSSEAIVETPAALGEQSPDGGNDASLSAQTVPRSGAHSVRAQYRLKQETAAVPGSTTNADTASQPVVAPQGTEVPAGLADAPVSLPKSADSGAKATDLAAHAQRLTAAGPVAVDVSNEGGGTAQNGTARQSANGGFREFLGANRPMESADASQAVPVFASASPEHVARPAAAPTVLPGQPLTTPEQEAENVTRLVESMRVQVRQGVSEATVRLRPEHLGEVTISIRVERGVVSAVVHAETPAVQQWLESQEDKLRTGLADQGLSLERFVVRERQPERREQRQQQQQPPPRHRQPPQEGQRFEVSV